MSQKDCLCREMKEAKLYIIKHEDGNDIHVSMNSTAAATCALIGRVLCELANQGEDEFECVKALCMSILEEAEENENAKD